MNLIDICEELSTAVRKYEKSNYSVDNENSYITMENKIQTKHLDAASGTNWFSINGTRESINKAVTSLTESFLNTWDLIDDNRDLDDKQLIILTFIMTLGLYKDNDSQVHSYKEEITFTASFLNKRELELEYNDLLDYTKF